MTPTADLMKMPFYDGTIEDFLRDHGICAGDRKALVAALTASCDARVGGEDMVCGGCGQPWTGPCAQQDNGWSTSPCIPVPATPAQPKASEAGCQCTGLLVHATGTPGYPCSHPKASEETEQSIKADAYDMVAEALRNAGLLESGGSVVDTVTALVRPKASEGKAGGEDVALLKHIAAIAHDGGLAGINPYDALSMIRCLSLPAWSATGSVNERQAGLAAAMTATLTAPGADDGQ